MKKVIPLLSLLALLYSVPTKAAEKDGKLPLGIFCPLYATGLTSVFVKTGADTYHDVALSTANVVDSEETLVEDGRITLHGPTIGDNAYPAVATAEVSGSLKPLLVLVPRKDGEGPAYDAKVVDGDLTKFPLGSFNFVNLSPSPVRVTAGREVIEIQSGADALFKPNVPAGETMPVTIDHKSGQDWQLVSSAQWASRDDRRTLVCFLLDPTSKRMIVKSVPLRETSAK